MKTTRRHFLELSSMSLCTAMTMGAIPFAGCSPKTTTTMSNNTDFFFDISLAQWSLNKALFAGELDHLDFPKKAKEDFDIHAVEYVNQFFKDKAKDKSYLDNMNSICADLGVKQLLIMVDGEGGLGDTDQAKRAQAVENHYKWVEAAKHLGCHSIRVNAYGQGSSEEVQKAAVEGLGSLATFAKDYAINVIVENHGGYSSNGKWLSGIMDQINMDNCGTLPDFGNFCIKREDNQCVEEYDRYQGTRELMKHAKAVSAKTHEFDESGNEVHSDYLKLMKIVKDAGYRGYVGIEYEGSQLDADAGIRATKKLLEKVGAELS